VDGDARITILYDEACAFCRAGVAALIVWDHSRRLDPLPIQSSRGARLLGSLPRAEHLRSAHAITPDGRVLSGSAAAPKVFAALPGGRPLAWLTTRGKPVSKLLYGALVRLRPRLGRVLPLSVRRASDRLIAERQMSIAAESLDVG
jgi:predicted DCC family thiol-disulfide oxidoreductase YuxK